MTTTTPDVAELLAAGYMRVSTESQLDGFGPGIQRDAITETAAGHHLELTEVYFDEGICGAEGLDVRRDLAAALDWITEHPGGTLIIPRLDRLARDLLVQETVLADIWKAGGHVLSCSETERTYCHPDNPEDPARTLIRQVLGAVAAYERSMIRLRLVRGRRRKLAATGYAGGIEPYGWTDPNEQAVLAYVGAQRRAGVTWAALADELNATGRGKRNGTPWFRQELQQVYARSVKRVS